MPPQQDWVGRIGLCAESVARNSSVGLEAEIAVRREGHQHQVAVWCLDPLKGLGVTRRTFAQRDGARTVRDRRDGEVSLPSTKCDTTQLAIDDGELRFTIDRQVCISSCSVECNAATEGDRTRESTRMRLDYVHRVEVR